MNKQKNTQALNSYIKPIINGMYYERTKINTNGYKGGYNGSICDYVVHIDKASTLKSGICAIVIEAKG